MGADISIIIPAYNAESSILRCIDSCVAQEGISQEIIVVNDGSTDRTELVLREASIKYPIHLITTTNAGPSQARNIGLDIAHGRYIAFCDADDWLDKNSLKQVITAMDERGIDIAISGYRNIRESGITTHMFHKAVSIDRAKYMGAILLDQRVMGFVFNKVYRSTVVKDVRFSSKMSVCEDADFNLHLINISDNTKIVALPGARYNYDLRQTDSLTRSDNAYPALRSAMTTFFRYGNTRFSKDVRASLFSIAMKAYYDSVSVVSTGDVMYARDYWLNSHCPLPEKLKMIVRILVLYTRGIRYGQHNDEC